MVYLGISGSVSDTIPKSCKNINWSPALPYPERLSNFSLSTLTDNIKK